MHHLTKPSIDKVLIFICIIVLIWFVYFRRMLKKSIYNDWYNIDATKAGVINQQI